MRYGDEVVPDPRGTTTVSPATSKADDGVLCSQVVLQKVFYGGVGTHR